MAWTRSPRWPRRRRRWRGSTSSGVDLIGDKTGRIIPIYPQSEKHRITTWETGGWVDAALRKTAARGLAEPLPPEVLERFGFIDRTKALRGIHLPEAWPDIGAARKRLVFDELLRIQL